jgi:DNA-binding transcriptional regulator YiaG
MQARTPSTIGGRIRALRTARGMSLRAAAELAGISEGHLSRIERSEKPVNLLPTLDAIARALRTTRTALLADTTPPRPTRPAAGPTPWRSGRLSGAVLTAVRHELDLAPDRLAADAGQHAATVVGWETAARPLTTATYGELQRLRHQLQVAGAPAARLQVFDNALQADTILDDLDAPPDRHPLGLLVPDRALTELLGWAMTGHTPRDLDGLPAVLEVDTADRDRLAAALRDTTEHPTGSPDTAAMIRRQAEYLLAGHEPSRAWVTEAADTEQRYAGDLSTWSPRWPVARTAAISAAVAGDPAPLERFAAEGLSSDAGQAANLNYWAYWMGESTERWATDVDMTRPAGWAGHKLLRTLLDGLEQRVPYRELTAHTLWALLACRRELLRPARVRARVGRVVGDTLATGNGVSDRARARLEQVAYLTTD